MKNRWLYFAAGISLPMMIFGMLLFGLALFGKLSTPLATSSSASWVNTMDAPFSTLRHPCKTGWERDADGRVLSCEELLIPPALASGAPTAAQITLNEERRVEQILLRITSYTPRIERTDTAERRLVSWEEVLYEELALSQCAPRAVPYFEARFFDCPSLSIAHTAVVNGASGNPTAHLFIGNDASQTYAAFEARAVVEARLLAAQQLKMATEFLRHNQFAAADRAFLTAYLRLLLVPAAERDQGDEKILTRIATARTDIAERATAQRQKYNSRTPLPAHEGIFFLTALLERSAEERAALLGAPEVCVQNYDEQICRYVDRNWMLDVVTRDERPVRLSFRLHKSEVLFKMESLRLFDLPVVPPAEQNRDTMQWVDFANTRSVTFFRGHGDVLQRVEVEAQ